MNQIQSCESPIEKMMFRELADRLPSGANWKTQVRIGRYRVDFLIDDSTVIEADGRGFHNFHKDRERDIDLILHHGIKQVIRFTGSALFSRIDRCVQTLKRLDPGVFGTRASLREVCEFAAGHTEETQYVPTIRRGEPLGDPVLIRALQTGCLKIIAKSSELAVIEIGSVTYGNPFDSE